MDGRRMHSVRAEELHGAVGTWTWDGAAGRRGACWAGDFSRVSVLTYSAVVLTSGAKVPTCSSRRSLVPGTAATATTTR